MEVEAPKKRKSSAPPWKAAVLFHGSGEEIDRYGSLPSKLLFGWQLKPRAPVLCSIKSTGAFRIYEQLAQFLASMGFATLLYDKRGCTSCGYAVCSSAILANCFQSGNITFQDLMADAAAAVTFMKTRSDLRPSDITLIGHSQGCTIVSTLAATTVGVGRAIRLMGLGRSYYDLSYRQYAANLQTDLSHQGYCDLSDAGQLAQKNFVFANVLPNSEINFNASLVYFPMLERGLTSGLTACPGTCKTPFFDIEWAAKSDPSYETAQIKSFVSSGGRVLLINSEPDLTVAPCDYLPLLFRVMRDVPLARIVQVEDTVHELIPADLSSTTITQSVKSAISSFMNAGSRLQMSALSQLFFVAVWCMK